jgi:alkyl sulfatase BDS1-like metallo-beta-lactamase superfamily hydrolase
MTNAPAEGIPEDFRSRHGMEPEEAAFFYRGPSQLVAEGVLFTPTQGNSTAFICDGRILLVDTSGFWYAPGTAAAVREHSEAPIEAIVYSHGHIDHVTGAQTFIADARARGYEPPKVAAHRDVPRRFDRYKLLDDQNSFINRYQFAMKDRLRAFTFAPWTYPDITYDQNLTLTVGGEPFELHHARGETDDETWVWSPRRRVLCTGDTFVWCSPNAGNPYKVQRYARDWADALEQMAALKPAHLLPGHGPAMSGEEHIQEALLTTAHFLRSIHDQVVARMNEGKWLEDILREIEYPPTDKPWLRPIYDHPEFVARNVYRLYGGWYDGDPANMLPAHSADIAAVLVSLAGADNLLARARKLRDEGDLQLACHITDFVRKGDPQSREGWQLWRDLFAARAAAEESLMARGAFLNAVQDADDRLKGLGA